MKNVAEMNGAALARAVAGRLRHLVREPSEAQRAQAMARVAAGASLARATGVAFFGDAVLETDGVLCPRADSECVVEAAVDHWSGGEGSSVVDAGTGSGALLIAFLLRVAERRPALAVGWDLCSHATAVARRNCARNGVTAVIEQRDWRREDASSSRRFDLCLWNPPYVATALVASIDDPALALDGGVDGLDAYRCGPPVHVLKPGGVLVCEIGAGTGGAVTDALTRGGAVSLVDARRDLQGIERALVFRVD